MRHVSEGHGVCREGDLAGGKGKEKEGEKRPFRYLKKKKKGTYEYEWIVSIGVVGNSEGPPKLQGGHLTFRGRGKGTSKPRREES